MANIPISPSQEKNTTDIEYINGKIVVTEKKTSEYNPEEILNSLQQKLVDQLDAKEKAIKSNDDLISELQAQIQEIQSKIQ